LSYIPEVISAHIQEAEFLFEQYLAGITSGEVRLESEKPWFAGLAARLNANLDGLSLNADIAWLELEPLLDEGASLQNEDHAGIFFVAAAIAFERGNVERIRRVLDQSASQAETLEAVAFAMAWQPWSMISFWAQKFIQSERFELAYVGLYVHLWHQQPVGALTISLYERLLAKAPDPSFLTKVLRLAVQTREVALVPVLRKLRQPESGLSPEQFLYLKARLLLGDTTALEALRLFVMSPGADQEAAIALVFSHLDADAARPWMRELQQVARSESGNRDRLLLQAIAALREKDLLPWVLKQMDKPELARLAGYAVACILGLDIETRGWVLDSEALDEQWLALEGDEMLPWPDAATIRSALGFG
jgi:uncharacterized protein (TIGR02270 family)